jgi:C4-dicarboxylate-specific signal transduction histidine kinase
MTAVLSALEDRNEATRIAAMLDGARDAGAASAPITVRSLDDRQLSMSARRVRGGSAIVVTCVDVSEWAGSVRALHQAQRELIDAAQLAVAGELVGGIAHDLRQPLAAIEMNMSVATHLLRQTPADVTSAFVALDDAMSGANVLRESVQVLQDLVAKREPAFADVNLATIVDDVIALVQAEASARGLAIERLVATAERMPSIQADASMLREATLALLLDAVENADVTVPDARVLISARPVENDVELVVHHRAQAGPTQVSVWARSVARSVADAHGASMSIDVDTLFGTSVRTTWPAVRVTRSIIE